MIGGLTGLEVYVFLATLLPVPYPVPLIQAVYAVLVSLFLLTVLALAVVLTLSDPTDSIVQQYRQAQQRK